MDETTNTSGSKEMVGCKFFSISFCGPATLEYSMHWFSFAGWYCLERKKKRMSHRKKHTKIGGEKQQQQQQQQQWYLPNQSLQQSIIAGCCTCLYRPTILDFDIAGCFWSLLFNRAAIFLLSANLFNFISKPTSSASWTITFISDLIFKFSTQQHMVNASKIQPNPKNPKVSANTYNPHPRLPNM